MQTKTFVAALGALALTAAAAPAQAGGYWDGGNPAIYGGGWCPPPAPPPCDCPQAYDEGPPPAFEAPPPGYGEDEGFAPSELFEEGGVAGPEAFGAEDVGGGGFVRGGPVLGFGFGFRDHDRRFIEPRQRVFERQRLQQHVSVSEHVQAHVSVQQHVMQPHQMRSYAHAMGGHGRW